LFQKTNAKLSQSAERGKTDSFITGMWEKEKGGGGGGGHDRKERLKHNCPKGRGGFKGKKHRNKKRHEPTTEKGGDEPGGNRKFGAGIQKGRRKGRIPPLQMGEGTKH